jgi:agmatinase
MAELSYLADNFAGLPPELSDYRSSRVVIFPLPYEFTSSYLPGSRFAPREIIQASRFMELYDEELSRQPAEVGIHTLTEAEPIAGDPETMLSAIHEKAKEILGDGKFIIAIGGEHSISYPLIHAHQELHPELSVLQLDAHADLRQSYQGTPFSHASVMRRVVEMVPLVQVGLRSMSQEEAEAIPHLSTRIFPAKDIVLQNQRDWIEEVIKNLTQMVYITIDADCFDPSVMPAVASPEPGGLSWYEVLSLLREVAKRRVVIGGDFVELTPRGDLTSQSSFTAARLIYKLIGYSFFLEKD